MKSFWIHEITRSRGLPVAAVLISIHRSTKTQSAPNHDYSWNLTADDCRWAETVVLIFVGLFHDEMLLVNEKDAFPSLVCGLAFVLAVSLETWKLNFIDELLNFSKPLRPETVAIRRTDQLLLLIPRASFFMEPYEFQWIHFLTIWRFLDAVAKFLQPANCIEYCLFLYPEETKNFTLEIFIYETIPKLHYIYLSL